MENKIDIKNYYLTQFDEFEKSLNGEKSSEFHKVRKEAIDKFAELTFPTQKDEEWKYTNISSLLKHNFSPAVVKANVSSFGNFLVSSYIFRANSCDFLNTISFDTSSNII